MDKKRTEDQTKKEQMDESHRIKEEQADESQMDEAQLNKKKIKEAWKTMTVLQKIEYLWMYYKSWLVGAVLVVGVIYLGVTMYKGMHTEVLLNITVVGGNSLQAEWLEESFAEYAGIEAEDGEIRVQANISASTEDANSQIALSTLVGAEAVDVLVCPKEIYDSYSDQDGFLDIGEVLGDDSSGTDSGGTEDALILKTDNILRKEEMISYDDAYAAVPVTTQHQEMAARFLEYLEQ